MIEAIVDRDEEWDRSLVGKEQYIDRPIQPPGLLNSGIGGCCPSTTECSTLQSCADALWTLFDISELCLTQIVNWPGA